MLIGIFGARAYHQWDYNRKVESGEIRVESLRGWMTLAYIAHTYKVPEADIRQALGLPASGNVDRSLRVWFKEAGIDPIVGRQKLEAELLKPGSKLQPATP
ncbi:hypothetical protein [Rhodoferax lacus]|uniref:hypothetical protein n=1 Tax=Rhodoferax lacus TaxID=2184758 RepID=UPI0011C17D08|nr:hypothetical protein [Rhodoferax lacus]